MQIKPKINFKACFYRSIGSRGKGHEMRKYIHGILCKIFLPL